MGASGFDTKKKAVKTWAAIRKTEVLQGGLRDAHTFKESGKPNGWDDDYSRSDGFAKRNCSKNRRNWDKKRTKEGLDYD